MEVYLSDERVVKEALIIIGEVYDAEQLEKLLLKILKKYKEHTDFGNCGWYSIHKYVDKQYKLEEGFNV